MDIFHCLTNSSQKQSFHPPLENNNPLHLQLHVTAGGCPKKICINYPKIIKFQKEIMF